MCCLFVARLLPAPDLWDAGRSRFYLYSPPLTLDPLPHLGMSPMASKKSQKGLRLARIYLLYQTAQPADRFSGTQGTKPTQRLVCEDALKVSESPLFRTLVGPTCSASFGSPVGLQ